MSVKPGQAHALLRRHRVKATFCLVGINVRAHPELVRAIADDGHTLCNHSWAHDVRLGRRSQVTIAADLMRTSRAIRAAAPTAKVEYFRQPGGAWTRRVVTTARRLGMTSLHWTIDPRDWTRPGSSALIRTVTAKARHGAIVLLHDGGGNRMDTVRALSPMLSKLRQQYSMTALPIQDTPSRGLAEAIRR
ncbi:polysaccharide deacetylase family protein [Plantactinospora sp. WMMB782]|uniref:polysaccharide deacetylase family protein n=1 Tax=Plantactinospora sp. WMMB782 TaxID=3404121 RepID=UPI003B957CE3